MPTQNSTQTYEMLKTYLDETADSFEKLDEEPGFLYRKTDGRTSLVFCARVDKELGFLLLSAYPGILVRTSYVPMVADYCQRITPEVGVVCVESNLCEVYYRTEVAFEHAPVSRATLELLERTAFAALTPHISALRSLSAGVLPEALPEPQEIHIPSPAPSHAEDFLPLMEEYFQKTHFTVLAKHAPDETGACYLYEFLAAHRRWKLHVTLNDEKTFFILRLFPGRNALVFDPRYLHAAAQICNAENDSVKSGALFVGRRPEGLCAKMALSALEVPTSLEETLYSAVSILVSLLYSREAEHRSRTQHTAAPAVADTTAEDTPEVSFARQFVYWLFALSASVFAAVCVFHEMQAAFTPPAHLDFLEDYVQQFVFEHAKALIIILTVFCIYLYGKTGAKKHRYNVLAYLCTVSVCCFAPPAAVFVLMAAPILMALALAVLVLGIVGLVKMAFG